MGITSDPRAVGASLTTNELGTMIMIGELSDQRLCNISTLWSVVALRTTAGTRRPGRRSIGCWTFTAAQSAAT